MTEENNSQKETLSERFDKVKLDDNTPSIETILYCGKCKSNTLSVAPFDFIKKLSKNNSIYYYLRGTCKNCRTFQNARIGRKELEKLNPDTKDIIDKLEPKSIDLMRIKKLKLKKGVFLLQFQHLSP